MISYFIVAHCTFTTLQAVSSQMDSGMTAFTIIPQGFPQVLRTWGRMGSSKFDGGRLESTHGGSMGGLKVVLKNTCERSSSVGKIASYKPENSGKKELFHTYFSMTFR